jgi:hypothetical protein
MAYGAHFGWSLFRTIMTVQSARFGNFGGFNALMFNPRVAEKPFMYFPFLLGFFVLVSDLRDKKYVEVGLLAMVYSAGITFLLPWNGYGWYLIPLYPALAFGLASFVVRTLREANGDAFWIWLLFSITYLCWIICDGQLALPQQLRWVYIGIAALTPFTSWASRRWPARWRVGFAAFVALQLIGDTWYTLRQ